MNFKFKISNKIRIILLLVVAFIITGCDAEYDLVVDDNNKVSESLKVINSNDLILRHNDSISLYLSSQIKVHKNIIQFSKYAYDKAIGDEVSSVEMSRRYNSLEDYLYSPIFTKLFETAEIVHDKEFTSFKTTGKYYYDNVFGNTVESEPDFFIRDINIKIKFYNEIIDSNADKIDEKNNTLEWNIDSNNLNKSIYFKTSKQKRYDIIVMDYIINNKTNLIMGFSTLVIALIIGLYIYIKYKRSDTI